MAKDRPKDSPASEPDDPKGDAVLRDLRLSNQKLRAENAELKSANTRLRRTTDALMQERQQVLAARSDMHDLFDDTEIATLFVDEQRRVMGFTPSSSSILGPVDENIGRPLADFAERLGYADLDAEAKRVAEELQPIERKPCIAPSGEALLVRIAPCCRADGAPDGLVVTVIELRRSDHYQQENAQTLARQYAELETIYASAPVGLALLDQDLRYLRVNERLAQINGFPVKAHIGKTQAELIEHIDEKIREQQLRVLETGEPAIGNEVRGHTPAQPGVERFWIADYFPVRTASGEIFALGCCVNEITQIKRLQLRLEQALGEVSESEERLEFALEAGKIGAWEFDIKTGATERTPLHDEIFGHQDMLAQWDFETFLTYVVEADRIWVASVIRNAFETGARYEFECRIRRRDGEERWVEARSRPRLDPGGELLGFAGTLADITERKEAEKRQTLLMHELQHRVKNTLATTLAIIRFSARRAESVKDFTSALSDRLQAIARTHDLLTTKDWRGGRLREIVTKETSPYIASDTDRVIFEGDDPRLSAAQMLALTLTFHELATNAAKYGAFCVPQGKVIVDARIGADGTLDVSWRETGGPAVTPPDEGSSGFGSFLLNTVSGPDLEGSAQIRYEETGVVWTASFPLDPSA